MYDFDALKELFNQYEIQDIEFLEVSEYQFKLVFISPQQQPLESQVFSDNELTKVTDMILASRSRLKLGC